jgi:hypothetical protein
MAWAHSGDREQVTSIELLENCNNKFVGKSVEVKHGKDQGRFQHTLHKQSTLWTRRLDVIPAGLRSTPSRGS